MTLPRHRLCSLNDLSDPGSRGCSVELAHGRLEIFIVRKYGELRAYRNVCPHTGVSLDWMPHRFLNAEQTLIICATHGALFEIDSGLCVAGPCLGDSLTPVRIEVVDGEIMLMNS